VIARFCLFFLSNAKQRTRFQSFEHRLRSRPSLGGVF
jgi:hypothetical protein